MLERLHEISSCKLPAGIRLLAVGVKRLCTPAPMTRMMKGKNLRNHGNNVCVETYELKTICTGLPTAVEC